MRILIITDLSLFTLGGTTAETRTLCEGLTARGHHVALACHGRIDVKIPVAHFPISLPLLRHALKVEVGRALEEFKPDFVHVLAMSSRGVTQLASLLRPLHWALTVHSLPPYERKLARWHASEHLHYGARAVRFLPNSLAWRWVFRSSVVPVVIVHSRYVEEIVVRYGYSRERINTIALPFISGQATQTTRNVSDSPLLVTVGGYAHTKGQHDLVKALPALCARFPGLRCQLIGEIRDNSYLVYLCDLAQSLGVADQLLITPDLRHADKQAALEAADVYVQPSHEEGFCVAYAEAAAIVPRLVGTETGAIAALSQNDIGARVVGVCDPAAIATAVVDLLRTELPLEHMQQRASRLAVDFSLDGYVQAHESIYAGCRRQL